MWLCQRDKSHDLINWNELSQYAPQTLPHFEAQRLVAFSALTIQFLKLGHFAKSQTTPRRLIVVYG
jgi:hypothetical protein